MIKGITAILLGANAALGLTYQDQDLLLIFRKDGFNDVEYNLGPISPLLSLAPATSLVLTNWDLSVVTNQYALTDGAQVALLATTPPSNSPRRAWLSDSDSNSDPLDLTPSQWQALWSKINSVGTKAAASSGRSPTNVFVVSPTAQAAFTFIESNGGSLPGAIRRLGGASAFNVVSTIPANVCFFEIKDSTDASKPAAALLGTFQLDSFGTLRYTASSANITPPSVVITDILFRQGTATITFPTVVGVQYRLRISPSLAGSPSTWATGTDVIAGTGGVATLTDSHAGADTQFYAVESFE